MGETDWVSAMLFESSVLRARCNEPGGIITENQLRPSRGRCIGVCNGRMRLCNAPMQCKRRVESSAMSIEQAARLGASENERANERANEVLRTHRSWSPFYPPSLQHSLQHSEPGVLTHQLTTSLRNIATQLGLSHRLLARHGASPDTPPVIQTLSGPSPMYIPGSHVLVPLPVTLLFSHPPPNMVTPPLNPVLPF